MKKLIGYIATAIIILLLISQCTNENKDIDKLDDIVEKVKEDIEEDIEEEKPEIDYKDEKYKLGNWITSSGGTNVELSILSSNKYIYTSDLTGATMGNWSGNNDKIIFYHEQYNVPIAEAKVDYTGELQYRSQNGTLFFKKK